jgi:peptidoglycan/xylan/chitin deacetylase (PgdA/CDA1 family)
LSDIDGAGHRRNRGGVGEYPDVVSARGSKHGSESDLQFGTFSSLAMRLKRAMKRAAVAAGRMMPRPNPSTRRVVFCYHSVHPDRPYASSTPDVFERHLQWLKEHCRLVSLVDLASGANISDTGKPVAAITFDDGYDDNHSYALPLLVRYGVPATFFITAGFVERDPTVLRRFQQLLKCGADSIVPLEWPQIRELRASGMDIGSHTYSHPNLARLSRAEAEEELRISKDVIGDRLGAPVDLFAYPFGKPRVHFTSTTMDAVRATGYRVAAAVTFRGVLASDPVFSIPRFFTDGDSLAKLEAKIQGAYDLVGRWQEHAPLPLMRFVSPEDFRS